MINIPELNDSMGNYTIHTGEHAVILREFDGHLSISVIRHDGANGTVVLNGQVVAIDPIPF